VLLGTGEVHDLVGQVTVGVSAAALAIGLIDAGAKGWSSTKVLACLATFLAGTALFVVVERRARRPMLVGLGLGSVGQLSLALAGVNTPYWLLLLSVTLVGFGIAFDVMPAIRTRRVSWWMNTST